MNCWTAEAISTFVKASMEARWKTRNANPIHVAHRLAARSSRGVDLRLVEIMLRYILSVPAPKAYDAK